MLDHCFRQSYVEFLVWEWWRKRFLWNCSCLSREWATQLPSTGGSGVPSFSKRYVPAIGLGYMLQCRHMEGWGWYGSTRKVGNNQVCPGLWRTAFSEELTHEERFTKHRDRYIYQAQERAPARHDHKRRWWEPRTPGGLEWWIWWEQWSEAASLSVELRNGTDYF